MESTHLSPYILHTPPPFLTAYKSCRSQVHKLSVGYHTAQLSPSLLVEYHFHMVDVSQSFSLAKFVTHIAHGVPRYPSLLVKYQFHFRTLRKWSIPRLEHHSTWVSNGLEVELIRIQVSWGWSYPVGENFVVLLFWIRFGVIERRWTALWGCGLEIGGCGGRNGCVSNEIVNSWWRYCVWRMFY